MKSGPITIVMVFEVMSIKMITFTTTALVHTPPEKIVTTQFFQTILKTIVIIRENPFGFLTLKKDG